MQNISRGGRWVGMSGCRRILPGNFETTSRLSGCRREDAIELTAGARPLGSDTPCAWPAFHPGTSTTLRWRDTAAGGSTQQADMTIAFNDHNGQFHPGL